MVKPSTTKSDATTREARKPAVKKAVAADKAETSKPAADADGDGVANKPEGDATGTPAQVHAAEASQEAGRAQGDDPAAARAVGSQSPGVMFDPMFDGGEDQDEIFGDRPDAPEEAAGPPEGAPSMKKIEKPKSSDGPETVDIGGVEGVRHYVPIETVQAIIGEDAANRAEALRGTPSAVALQKRMRATDGRCAPMILTHDGDDKNPPLLFSGLESYGSAKALGYERMFVVIIAPADAGRVQSVLQAQAQQPADADDEEMFYKVRAHYEGNSASDSST